MTIWSVINSLTFRYIAKYVVVLSASVFLLLAALYAYISYGFLYAVFKGNFYVKL